MQTESVFTLQVHYVPIINLDQGALVLVVAISDRWHQRQAVSPTPQKDHHQRSMIISVTRYIDLHLICSSTHLESRTSQR